MLWALEHKPDGILTLLEDFVPSLRWPTFSLNMSFTLLIGRFAGTVSVRELSSEILCKNKGRKRDHEDVNQRGALGRKMISLWEKDIRAFYSNEAFCWKR